MSYNVHNFQTGQVIEAAPINEMDQQIKNNADMKLDADKVGAADGVASLDSNGKVPESQLPSMANDVEEYANRSSFPGTGETGKIYVDKSANKLYRWDTNYYMVGGQIVAFSDDNNGNVVVTIS